MNKKVVNIIKIQIKAQQATPAPPLGPQVGQFGINIMNLCKEINEQTKSFDAGSPVPILLTIYQDKSFSFIIKTPPSSYLIRQKAVEDKGKLYLSMDDVCTIARTKLCDLTASNMEAACRTIIGTAKSMGIFVKNSSK